MTEGTAIAMVNRCFAAQHPEAFGRADVPDAIVPTELRYGREAPVIVLAGTYP